VDEKFIAIVNPAAGGGRSAKLAGGELARLREVGLRIDVIASTSPGHASELAHEAYEQGYRRLEATAPHMRSSMAFSRQRVAPSASNWDFYR